MGNWKSGPGWGVGRQEAAGSSARELLEAHAHITVLPGFSPQSTAEGSGLKVRERTMTVPQGTVMAYKKKQLVFREDGRGEQGLKVSCFLITSLLFLATSLHPKVVSISCLVNIKSSMNNKRHSYHLENSRSFWNSVSGTIDKDQILTFLYTLILFISCFHSFASYISM